jgi:hypothetical protein
MTRSSPAQPGSPLPFPSPTLPIAVRFLELTGWGGGPGMVFAKSFRGEMHISAGDAGMLRVHCLGRVITDRWTAEALVAVDPTPVPETAGERQEKRYLKAGTTFFTHASAVRVMG